MRWSWLTWPFSISRSRRSTSRLRSGRRETGRSRFFRPRLEWLEERIALAGDFALAFQRDSSLADTVGPVAVDASGNVVMAGSFRGTVDFDPGPASVPLVSAGVSDAFVAKYTSEGALLWARQLGGTNLDNARDMRLDAVGNVYIAGQFQGTADFDPGAAQFNLRSVGDEDGFVAKLDTAGNFVWAKQFGGTTGDGAVGIALDATGNVHVTGYFTGTVDFNPGPPTLNLVSTGDADAFVIKLNNAGNLIWARPITGVAQQIGFGVAVDVFGNVLVSGTYIGSTDFNPGPTVASLPNAGLSDGFVCKLDASGNFVWVRGVGGARDDSVNQLATDRFGNVYASGDFQLTADLDPGPGITIRTSAGGLDGFVWKLTPAGSLIWVRTISSNNPFGNDSASALALDAADNVYVTGSFNGTIDLDPGLNTFKLVSNGATDVYAWKLDAAGNFGWARKVGGSDFDRGRRIAVGANSSVYVTGLFRGTADFDPGANTFNLTSAGQNNAFLVKLTDRSAAPAGPVAGRVWHDLDNDGVQDANEPGISGAAVEILDAFDDIAGDANDVSHRIAVTDADGRYQFTGLITGVDYYLAFRPPVGIPAPSLRFAPANAGGNDAIDSDPNTATGRTAPLVLIAGAGAVTFDAGLTGSLPSFGWALRADATNLEFSRPLTIDAAGNVYVTGSFTGTRDFDPGPGVVNLTSAGNSDAYVAKYTPAGALVWARAMGGSLQDNGSGVAVDVGGNVFLTGNFHGTADFDPGPSAVTLTSWGNSDVFLSKLDAAGNLVWVRRLGGNAPDIVQSIVADADGNVYATGDFRGTVDFDPGAGTNILFTHFHNAFVWKLTGDGNLVWARQLGEGGFASGVAITVQDGNIYTTGYMNKTADFDPGAGTFNLVGQGLSDIFVSKLDAGGNFVWARRAGGPNAAGGVNSAPDVGMGIAADAAGNVYTTGSFLGTADFDPGAGTFNLVNVGADDAFVWKLDAGGNFVWARQLGGNLAAVGNAIALDSGGNVYTTGHFAGTADFDPGGGQFNLGSAGQRDVFVSKLDTNGNFVSARRLGAGGVDQGNGIAVDATGNVYTTGTFAQQIDFDPAGASIFPLTASGLNAFIWKLAAAKPAGPVVGRVWHDLDKDGIQDANEPGIAGAVAEAFDSVDGIFGNDNDVSRGIAITDANGDYQIAGLFSGIEYYVVFRPPVSTPPPAFRFSPANAAANDAIDSDANPGTARTALFQLAPGGADLDAGLMGSFPSFGWAARTGSTNQDSANDVATDAAGNVYVTGYFVGTVDFDPGPGIASLKTAGNIFRDAYVAKYTAAGALVWARALGGADFDQGDSIGVDAAGNVYVSGTFSGTADFDPSANQFLLTSAGLQNVFVVKLDAAGEFQWAGQFGGAFNENANGLAVDGAGNVHFTGVFYATGDFDPGPGVVNLTTGAFGGLFLCKLDTDGKLVWARTTDGPGSTLGDGVAVDAAGNVYTTGVVYGTSDFDPGPGTATTNGSGFANPFVWKLDSAGNFLWVRAADTNGFDYRYDIALDAAGNIYTSGGFNGSGDFDPGPGTFTLSSAGAGPGQPQDVYVWKLDAAGNFGWARRLGGRDHDAAPGIAADAAGNVYVTGLFAGSADFDPGPGTYSLASAYSFYDGFSSWDAFVVKLDAAGNFVWVRQAGGPSTDAGHSIAVDVAGNVYTAGYFAELTAPGSVVDFDPGPVVFNLTTAGFSDAFVWRLNRLSIEPAGPVSGRVWRDLDGDGLQDAGEPAVAGSVVEIFDALDGVVGNGDDLSRGTVVTGDDGRYQFTGLTTGADYYVVFRPPVGTPAPSFGFTTANAGADDALDSDPNPATGRTGLFRPSAGAAATAFDAGLTGEFPPFGWAARAGSTDFDSGAAIDTDAAGNVYVTGTFLRTADFDPGPGVFNLTSAGNSDVFVVKYTAAGALVWARALGGTREDTGQGIEVDATGNVVVVGAFYGTADFDPGPGVLTLTSEGNRDVFVAKLDASGNLVWVRRLGGAGSENADTVALDASGNVYTTGNFIGTVDFDPDIVDTVNLTAANHNAFVWKLNAVGRLVWARQLGRGSFAAGTGIAVDDNGVYATGYFSGTADFNPDAIANFSLVASGYGDVFVVKLDTGGMFVWARRMGGANAGNYDLSEDIAVDAASNVYTIGRFHGVADFNPDVDVASLTSAGNSDVFVSKLNSFGNFVWARRLGGTNSDEAHAVGVDASGNVYTVGEFRGTADFNPGSGTFSLTSTGSSDVFVSKLDAGGNFVSAYQLGGTNFDSGNAVELDAAGNIYATGSFAGQSDFDLGAGLFNLTSAGSSDMFVWKLAQPVAGPVGDRVWHDLNANGIQDPSEPGIAGVTVRLLDTAGNVLRTSTTDANGLYRFVGLTPGDYRVLFTAPVGYLFSSIDRGADDTVDNDADAATGGTTALFTLNAGQENLTVDAGFYRAAFISDFVWNDLNANGVQDPGEPGLANVTVRVTGTDGDGAAVNRTTTTDANGIYRFPVVPGTYAVMFTNPGGGFLPTGPNQGGDDARDSDADKATGATASFTLTSGDDDRTADAGFYLPVSIVNRVFHDLNANGIQDAGEPGIAGAVVELFQSPNATVGDADDVSLDTQVTDAAGNYLLNNLTLGLNYYLAFRPPVGTPQPTFNFSPADAGGNDVLDSDADAAGRTALFTFNGSNHDFDAGLVGSFPAFGWAVRAGGVRYVGGETVTTDVAGNVYVAGEFNGGPLDLDPGPGVYNLENGGGDDAFVAKYTPAGALVWAAAATGAERGWSEGIGVDAAGNVYVTGYFTGTADFDPGPGVFNLTSFGPPGQFQFDAFVWKLDAAGHLVWAVQLGGPESDAAEDLDLDAAGNVYISGEFRGTADFDPTDRDFGVTSFGGDDAFVVKLDPAGRLVWVRTWGSTFAEYGFGLDVTPAGNVHVVGTYFGTVDFDPTAGVAELISAAASADIYALKLNTDGLFVWARSIGGTGREESYDIGLDAADNVYIAGHFFGTSDFDPGAGVFALTSTASHYDVFALKLDSAGMFAWAKQLGGSGGEAGWALAVDPAGNVSVTGYFPGTVDFDPGPGVFNLTATGNDDAYVWQLNTAGNLVRAARFGTVDFNFTEGLGIATDSSGRIYVSGWFGGTTDFDPGPGTFNLTENSTDQFGLDLFVVSLM